MHRDRPCAMMVQPPLTPSVIAVGAPRTYTPTLAQSRRVAISQQDISPRTRTYTYTDIYKRRHHKLQSDAG